MSPRKRVKDDVEPAELIEDRQKLAEFLRRAQDGDREILPVLRKVLDEEPKIARFVDLARSAERTVVEVMSGDDLYSQEALPRNLAEMREEVAGKDPSPLERLLAERIVACWLQLQYFETIHMQNLKEGLSFAQAEYQQKRIDKAHKRYLSSIRALAQVRKLLKPSVAQINIAEKQVNTAG